MQWLLDLVVLAALAATCLLALRLERALAGLRRDGAMLETLHAGFRASSASAEQGIERLRSAAEGAGRQIAGQTAQAAILRDEMAALIERGERLAERLERGLRATAAMMQPAIPVQRPSSARWEVADDVPAVDLPAPRLALPAKEPAPRPRSQAERDLLAALRSVR